MLMPDEWRPVSHHRVYSIESDSLWEPCTVELDLRAGLNLKLDKVNGAPDLSPERRCELG